MTTRILPCGEWSRLAGSFIGPLLEAMTPEQLTVLVVEDASGAIVGSTGLFSMLHWERTSVVPAHQGRGAVLRRLYEAVQAECVARGVGAVVCAATPAAEGLLAKLGAEPTLPCYIVPTEGY